MKNVELHQTGVCIRHVDRTTGLAYWQAANESSKDTEHPMPIGEPLVMKPWHFQVGTAIVVMEPNVPVIDPELANLSGDSHKPNSDGASGLAARHIERLASSCQELIDAITGDLIVDVFGGQSVQSMEKDVERRITQARSAIASAEAFLLKESP